MTTIKKYIPYILLLIGLIIGFLAGRSTIKSKPEIKYVKGETIIDSVFVPKPYFMHTPTLPMLPMKTDTIRIKGRTDTLVITQSVDTAVILADYIVERDYKMKLFDDQKKGSLTVFPSVQYNKLTGMKYEYTPIAEVQTIERKRVFTPFVGIGYSTNNYINAGIGIYYHNAGLEYRYNYNNATKNNYHTVNLNVKF